MDGDADRRRPGRAGRGRAEHHRHPGDLRGAARPGALGGAVRRRPAAIAAESCSPATDNRGQRGVQAPPGRRAHPAYAAARRRPHPGRRRRRPAEEGLTMQVTMTVNGERSPARSRAGCCSCTSCATTLGLTGTHWGCDTSNCGTCVVWLDGEPVKSCTVLAAMAGGHEVRTVEGLEQDGVLDPVQQGFMQCHGLQCGFCTPGMMMTARALLDRNPDPTSRRSARRSPARSAAAPATRPSSARCSGPPSTSGRGRGERVVTTLDEGVAAGPEDLEHADNDQHPVGHGRMLRKEDPRFVRGMGQLRRRHPAPGMLHLAILRSPVAHARIVSIDISAAEAHPKVKAVVTGADARRAGPGLDADPVQRRAGRAGHRQGALPGPGGRLRRRRGPLLRARRARADRRRVRHAAAGDRRPEGARRRTRR